MLVYSNGRLCIAAQIQKQEPAERKKNICTVQPKCREQNTGLVGRTAETPGKQSMNVTNYIPGIMRTETTAGKCATSFMFKFNAATLSAIGTTSSLRPVPRLHKDVIHCQLRMI
jgi:hypothetical protein